MAYKNGCHEREDGFVKEKVLSSIRENDVRKE